ncbi:MAG: folylpolyglutamate synthase/dihydrofolate synthase family protein [Hydrogenoanaerobacterium sp.]
MNYDEALEYIHAHKRFSGAPTLARMRKLMYLLGNPQSSLRFVHIAGTNGKGSTTAMTAAVLKNAGFKTGQYVSPFVLCFCERMQINGKMISENELAEIAEAVRRCEEVLAKKGESCRPTEFEVVTAIAFVWFARQKCDIVCLEVGLGGRFDATNVIEPPAVQIITAISLDHTAILGDSVEKIAYEKSGIIKGATVICYPLQPTNALAVIMEQCALCGASLIQPNINSVQHLGTSFFEPRFNYGGLTLQPSLLGEHQTCNAITVVEACRALRTVGFGISDENICNGIANTVFPARLEPLSREPVILLDGAHNPGGAEALESALLTLKSEGYKSLTVLMGMLEDKDWQHSVERIARCADSFIAVTPCNPRALAAEALAEHARLFCAHGMCAQSVASAAEAAARQLPRTGGGALVVCGSLYLAAQLRPVLLASQA